MKFKSDRVNPLDLLLLVLIKYGLSTTYDIRAQAGIGGSNTVKQLQLLEKDGLLTSVSGNERKAKRYAITGLGESKLLESLVLVMQQRGRLGIDSLTRTMFLGWLYPEQVNAVDAAQETAAALEIYRREKELEAAKHRDLVDRLQRRLPNGDYGSQVGQLVASTFMWIRAKSDMAMLEVQATAIDQLKLIFENLPPKPRLEIAKENLAAVEPQLEGQTSAVPSRWRERKKRKPA